MTNFPNTLQSKLDKRQTDGSLRVLEKRKNIIDFFSNDYLGFAQNKFIYEQAHNLVKDNDIQLNGSTGSRLLGGNNTLFEIAEQKIAHFHNTEAALIFNSGYNANLGLLSCIVERNDIILYDELCHASIRDGIVLSGAKAYKFLHNNIPDLENKLQRFKHKCNKLYIVTETVFSMDGDSPDLNEMVTVAKASNAYIIVDEAHAVGVFGTNGEGLINELKLQNEIFARIVTFGKALGCHGAAILGSANLVQYLINFSRSYIYTTALPPHAIATILESYKLLQTQNTHYKTLKSNIELFEKTIHKLNLEHLFVESKSAIQIAVIQGNNNVKQISNFLKTQGFDVRPILYPTVPKGKERLRFCLHAYNTSDEIIGVLTSLKKILT